MGVVTPLGAACSGFLLAVLWMDLIFDVQVLAHRKAGAELPEPVLASIAAYYRRATTTARPMNRLIALVMLILLGTIGFRATIGIWWMVSLAAVLGGVPIVLAAVRTVPHAVRLGSRADAAVEQARLARGICRDHLVCLGLMFGFLIVWLAPSAVA